MGSLSFLVILASFAGAILLGYQSEWNPLYFSGIVLFLMIGQIMRRSSKSNQIFKAQGIGLLFEMVVLIVLNTIMAGIGYGVGYALIELLAYRPEGGL